ncbi:putative membrane protein [Clavibacter michiganensis]|uniref:hypothetical protein n=1 Tax=Clavibacter michiganensis TaxID=28447 RepID=UPI001D8A88C0|nr:hypothetical protein [Clavibacter michiganensis]MBP2457669.1 putative membrane protein [Clavibacter michiganensis]MDQ0410239.1 putative membrane protein [Clavibacter michiganensis]
MGDDGRRLVIRRAFAWHRPLMAVAALMAVVAAACLVGGLVDDRVVTGAPVWDKPAKFSLSILVYAVSWAWLIARLPRFRRTAHRLGTVVAVALVVEQAVIVGAAAAGTTSHFNISSPLATTLWAVMAASITVLYLCTFVTSLAVLRLRLPDPALTLAIRAGALIALVGIGLAYLMTSPTAAQLADFHGVAGAHTVGAADGGPGIPVLGWSTTAGDLRIPHFVGMHALQLLPIAALLLGAVGRRIPALAPDRVRVRLTAIAAVAYLAVMAIVTVQALGGEPVTAPSAGIATATAAVAVVALVAAVAAVLRGVPRPASAGGGGHVDGTTAREASAPDAQPSAASSLAEISSRSK